MTGLCGAIGFSGVFPVSGKTGQHWQRKTSGVQYTLRPGDEQVLSRWNMISQKITVSREQCAVKVLADGTALLTSRGRGPTLWREHDGRWYALGKGESVHLSDGDQVSLDCNEPDGTVFVCHESPIQQDAYEQDGYSQQLPYPWEQHFDQNGAVYYANLQTGEAQWDPPQPVNYHT